MGRTGSRHGGPLALGGNHGQRLGVQGANVLTDGLFGRPDGQPLADQLAPVAPRLVEADWTGAASVINEALGQRALVVLITSIDPAAVEAGLLRAIAPVVRKHTVVVASVDDPEIREMATMRDDALDIYSAAAATRFELERAGVAARLKQRGLEVVSSSPDGLAPALADAYLELKRAGKL